MAESIKTRTNKIPDVITRKEVYALFAALRAELDDIRATYTTHTHGTAQNESDPPNQTIPDPKVQP